MPGRWGSKTKVPSVGKGGGGEIGHFLELHNEVLNTMLAGSTTQSLSSPHAVFAQLFSIRFPRYLEAWNRLQGERNIYFHMTVQTSNSVKTFQRKDKPSLTCHYRSVGNWWWKRPLRLFERAGQSSVFCCLLAWKWNNSPFLIWLLVSTQV